MTADVNYAIQTLERRIKSRQKDAEILRLHVTGKKRLNSFRLMCQRSAEQIDQEVRGMQNALELLRDVDR